MKIKDLERTVNVAWSPASQYPILLAAGTAANQLDASFSTNAALELYALNLADPGMDMELKGSVLSDNRFYKIVWGTSNDSGSGIIVGGCDGGLVQMYSASKLLAGEDCLISRQDKHNGPVQSLDFNPFQSNLLATGAADSEIYIWDLNNTSTPMTPGSKSQPYENVQSLSWNRQVQHILATTFHTRCVVWDLRKNEPIIKLTDTSSHIRWKHVSWHPEVATQLCLASEEDQAPVIQLWDLRFATSPLKVLDNHQRGVLSVAWCVQDSDLLISCGKDNRILCWNANSNQPRGEVLSEVAQTLQWNFDIAWCPRNPALIAASSFDGHVSVYSLMGGKQQQVQTSNKIADSFPGMDGYIQAPVPQQAPPVSVDLAKAPKWLKKPVGASFGFGGKLITFENDKNAIAQMQQAQQPGQVPPLINRTVTISQVITEPELIQKSNELEQAVQLGNFAEYCRLKADSSATQHERYVWYFIKANFDPNPKSELLNLLGFQADEINAKLNQLLKKPTQDGADDVNHLTDQMSSLNRCDAGSNPDLPSDIGADLLGDDFNASSTFDAIAADNKVNAETKERPMTPFQIKIGDDTDGCIAQALLLGNIEAAVELCLESNRMADALIIAMTGGAELLARTQYRYLQQSKGYVSALISALVSEDWSTVINQCSIESWKEALAAAITYSSPEELPVLCERLGERLETEHNGNAKLLQDAQLCYICAGSFNKLVASWSADASSRSPKKLQELVELVTFMQKAIEQQGRNVEVTGNLADLLSQYAILLASQGSLNNALNYLGSSTDPSISELRDRLYCNLGHKPAYTTQQQRMSNTRQSIPGYTNQQQAQFNQPQNTYNQSYHKFNTGLPNAATNQQQPWQNQTSVAPVQPFATQPPKPFTPTPSVPPTQPPRPTSVGSAHSSSGIGGRSKYVVDPSVKSNMQSYGGAMRTPYATNAMNNPTSMPANPMAPTNTITNPMMPTNQMMNNPAAPPIPMIPTNPMSQSNPSGPPNLMMPPMGAQNPMMPQSPGASLPTKPMAPSNPFPTFSQSQPIPATNPMQNSSIMTPTVPNQGFTSPIQNQPGLQSSMPGAFPNPSVANMYNPGNVEVAQPAINAFQNVTAPPGWNDPPVVSKGTRPQLVEQTTMSAHHAGTRLWKSKQSHNEHKQDVAAPQAPITHPLYGTAPEMAPVNNGYGEPPGGQYGQMAPPMQQQQQQMNRFPMATQQYQQQQQPPQQQAPPDPPKQKPPVPEEHMYLQTVFDELKNQCTCAANNPQTKRKLDDVSRKLETLYDMLREHKLSPNTLSGLHQMVQMVQIGDYTGGLGLHTQLVSGPDFAQIASFMPGLKVLLQCALQLQVYLR